MVDVHIERVVAGGDGLARIGGSACLIPYALPGESIRITEPERRSGALRAGIKHVLSPSADRQPAQCPVFGVCGGCTWLHFAYPAQADAKRDIVAECFRRIAGHEVEIKWADDPSLRFAYRTRATFRAMHGRVGFLEARSHQIVDIAACPLCHPQLNAALARLRESHLVGEFDVTVNPEGDDILIWTRDPVPGLDAVFPASNNCHISAPRHQFLFDGIPIVCGGFAQASLLLNRTLRSLVHKSLGGISSLLDLYCGSGNFSLGLSDVCVLGIDHHAPSIAAANALRPGAYECGGEPAFVRALTREPWDTILLDPPRQGAKPIVAALAQARAQRIVYVSCDPATLARDAKVLLAANWSLASVTAVDMFPHTAHVEAVAVFVRDIDGR